MFRKFYIIIENYNPNVINFANGAANVWKLKKTLSVLFSYLPVDSRKQLFSPKAPNDMRPLEMIFSATFQTTYILGLGYCVKNDLSL